MASTASGWQYAVPNDTLVAWPAVSQAVADKLQVSLPFSAGLQLIKTQSIGSGVSSIPVSSAFSAAYDNYKIVVTNSVGSTNLSLMLTLTGASASYSSSVIFGAYSGGSVGLVNLGTTSFSQAGDFSTAGCSVDFDLHNPFLALRTGFRNHNTVMNAAGSAIAMNGVHNVSQSYSGFTFTTSSGTITGGTIYVYGYAKV